MRLHVVCAYVYQALVNYTIGMQTLPQSCFFRSSHQGELDHLLYSIPPFMKKPPLVDYISLSASMSLQYCYLPALLFNSPNINYYVHVHTWEGKMHGYTSTLYSLYIVLLDFSRQDLCDYGFWPVFENEFLSNECNYFILSDCPCSTSSVPKI